MKNLPTSANSTFDVLAWQKSCYDAMDDDFNTPILMAQLFEGVRYINLIKEGKEKISETDLEVLKETFTSFLIDVLGLNLNENSASDNSSKLEGVVNMLIEMRNEARANKNWALSDEIRDRLLDLGVQLKDGKEGTSFTY